MKYHKHNHYHELLLVLLLSCHNQNNPNIKTTLEYVQCAKNAVEDNKYMSIKLTKHSLFNDIEDPTEIFYIIYCYDKKNPSFTVINSDSTKTMIFDKENYFLIDHNTREIACINKCNNNGKKAYWNMKNHAKGYLREMPYYHQLLEKDFYSSSQLIHNSVTVLRWFEASFWCSSSLHLQNTILNSIHVIITE